MVAVTSTDVLWAVVTVLWVGGCVTLYLLWWVWAGRPNPGVLGRRPRINQTGRDLARGGSGSMRHDQATPAVRSTVRVRRPPYDWAVHGDGHDVIVPTGGIVDRWGVHP